MRSRRQLLISAESPVPSIGLGSLGSRWLPSWLEGRVGTRDREYVELRLELCTWDKLTQGSGQRTVDGVTRKMPPREPSITASHCPAHVLLQPASPGSRHEQP